MLGNQTHEKLLLLDLDHCNVVPSKTRLPSSLCLQGLLPESRSMHMFYCKEKVLTQRYYWLKYHHLLHILQFCTNMAIMSILTPFHQIKTYKFQLRWCLTVQSSYTAYIKIRATNVQKYKWLKFCKVYILHKIIPYDIMIDKIEKSRHFYSLESLSFHLEHQKTIFQGLFTQKIKKDKITFLKL